MLGLIIDFLGKKRNKSAPILTVDDGVASQSIRAASLAIHNIVRSWGSSNAGLLNGAEGTERGELRAVVQHGKGLR